MAIGKISTARRDVADATINGIQYSLQQKGLTMYPGAKVRIPPLKEIDGSYRTGLDENALYIRRMAPEEARIEKERVRELRAIIEEMYGGQDLGPRSKFYSDMFNPRDMGTESRCPLAVLKDGDNIFNLDIKEQAVVYAYLRVQEREVAPSAEALMSGNYTRCKFYVNDSDVESEKSFKQRSKINKAIATLDTLGTEKRKQIARVIGLAVVENTKESVVYNILDKYIKDSENPRTSNHADIFLKYTSMKDDNLVIMDTIKQCLTHNVLRNQGGSIYKGESMISGNEEDATKYYANPKKQQEYLLLQEELKLKQSVYS